MRLFKGRQVRIKQQNYEMIKKDLVYDSKKHHYETQKHSNDRETNTSVT